MYFVDHLAEYYDWILPEQANADTFLADLKLSRDGQYGHDVYVPSSTDY